MEAQTTVPTALGRTNRYTAKIAPDGSVSGRTVSKAYGASSSSATGPDGKRTVSYEGGSALTNSTDPDPRFGWLTPMAASVTVQSGAQQTVVATDRKYSTTDPFDPFSLTSFSETTTVDGNASVRTYDRAPQSITYQSAMGRTSVSKLNELGQVVEIDRPGVAPVTITYDSRGRPTGYTRGARSWSADCDEHGYVASTTDAAGRAQHYTRDAVGRVLSSWLDDAATAPTIHATFDADSNLTSLTPPAGDKHSLSYTPVDLLASYTPPTLGATQTPLKYAYNLDRQVTDVTRADGSVVHMSYDAAKARLTDITLPSDDRKVSFVYDDAVTKDVASSSGPAGTSVNVSYTDGLVSALTWSHQPQRHLGSPCRCSRLARRARRPRRPRRHGEFLSRCLERAHVWAQRQAAGLGWRRQIPQQVLGRLLPRQRSRLSAHDFRRVDRWGS